MRIPKWKILLSYIYPLTLEVTGSELNETLIVLLKKGRFQLCTTNAIYSYGDLYDNFREAFRQIDLDRLNPEYALLLGLGLGSVPFITENCENKIIEYVAVEIDDVIAHLAFKYVIGSLKSPMTVVSADAEMYVKSSTEKFDMIAVDLFVDDYIPKEFESLEFLENIKSRLSEGGFIIYNRLGHTEDDKKKTSAFFDNKFLEVFPDAISLPIKGNFMLLSDKSVLK